jgi:hypothetical protein
MPDRIAARLRAELDAVRPAVANPAAARYRAPIAARPGRPRLAGYALAGALGAVLMAGVATLASGSPNPEVWTMQVAAGIHRLQEPPSPLGTPPPTPAAAPAATDVPKPVLAPRPAPPTADGGRNEPGERPEPAETPEARESPRPEPSEDSHEGPPAATPRPIESPHGGDGDGGSSGRPSPSPSTRDR